RSGTTDGADVGGSVGGGFGLVVVIVRSFVGWANESTAGPVSRPCRRRLPAPPVLAGLRDRARRPRRRSRVARAHLEERGNASRTAACADVAGFGATRCLRQSLWQEIEVIPGQDGIRGADP